MSSPNIRHMVKWAARKMHPDITACGNHRNPISLVKDPKDCTCLACLRNRGFMAEYRRKRSKRKFVLRPVTP